MATEIKEYEPLHSMSLADGKEVTIITRKEWNAMPPKIIHYIKHPIAKFHFKVETNVPPCTTKEECLKAVKEVQNWYSDLGMEDTPYNFLVCNDGNVYEGRGWHYKPGPEVSFKREYRDDTLQIGLIGGHEVATDETMGMVRSLWLMAKRVCNLGVKLKYAKEDYEIVGFKDDMVNFNVEFKP